MSTARLGLLLSRRVASRRVAYHPVCPPTRLISTSPRNLDVPSWPSPPVPQPPVGPSDDLNPRQSAKSKAEETFWHAWTTSASFQAALTTVVGLGMVFGAGIGYLEWYKQHVLHRVRH
jgi:hypothetical protein